MDVKTLSTIIGHVSPATTLNTYTHVTDKMRQKAAVNIDRGIAKAEVQSEPEQKTERPHTQEPFTPVLSARRRPGTGYLKQLNDRLWEGRYSPVWPDGVSPKKKAVAAYLREHPGVTNKAKIARDLNMDRTTVQKYYDEVRAELRGEESPVPQT